MLDTNVGKVDKILLDVGLGSAPVVSVIVVGGVGKSGGVESEVTVRSWVSIWETGASSRGGTR